MSDVRKQYAETTSKQSKHIISLLKKRKVLSEKLITLWENIDGCDEHYICATELYLLYMLSQAFYVIINHGIIAPVNVRKVAYGINVTEKRFLFQLISTVKLPGKKGYDTQTPIKYGIRTFNVSLSQELKKHLSNAAQKHGVIYQGK